jgi:aerotolerance regulator-like protein/VWA domain-containing protein
MSFLTPLYLVGAALIALPVVLHLLRRDVAPQVPFTAVRLLRVTSVERSHRQRLRDLLLLLARVTALLLLAGAFARPYLRGAAATAKPTVVAIDRSFSMAAPGRFAEAQSLARSAIDEARGGRVALIAFDDRAEIVAPLGLAADARAALTTVAAGAGATRYAPMLDKAADLLDPEGGGRLVVIGDLQRTGFEGSTPTLSEGIDFVVRDAGGARGNLAVTDVRLAGRTAVATVRNYGGSPVETTARLSANQQVRETRRVGVDAGTAATVTFDAPVGADGFSVAIDDPNGYRGDDERFLATGSVRPPGVLIVSGGPTSTSGFFLSRALTAPGDGGVDFEVKSIGGQAFSAVSPADLEPYRVIAVLSTHGLDRRAKDTLQRFLREGGGLLVAAAPDVDPSVLSALLDWQPALAPRDADDAGVLAVSDVRHPIFKPFDAVAANFGQVSFAHIWQIEPASGWQAIARYTSGAPALVERAAGAGRVLLFTSDVDHHWNDFPLHPSFVPFVHEAARYLGARPRAVASCLVGDVPSGVPDRPGLVTTGGRLLAVNADVRESSIDRVTPAEFLARVHRTPMQAHGDRGTQPVQTEARQGYWRYGLMLMLAALIAEAILGSK